MFIFCILLDSYHKNHMLRHTETKSVAYQWHLLLQVIQIFPSLLLRRFLLIVVLRGGHAVAV